MIIYNNDWFAYKGRTFFLCNLKKKKKKCIKSVDQEKSNIKFSDKIAMVNGGET